MLRLRLVTQTPAILQSSSAEKPACHRATTVGSVDSTSLPDFRKTNTFSRNCAGFCDDSRALFSSAAIRGFEQYRDRFSKNTCDGHAQAKENRFDFGLRDRKHAERSSLSSARRESQMTAGTGQGEKKEVEWAYWVQA